MKWAKKVEMHFLMKGHTHDKIDALFGIYAKRLKKLSWANPKELADHIER